MTFCGLTAAAFLLAAGCQPASDTTPAVAKASPVVTDSGVSTPSLPPTPKPSASPFPSPSPALYVALFNAQDYGYVGAETAPGASCSAHVTLPNGKEAPGLSNPKVVGPDGLVSWRYPTVVTDDGIGIHMVTCNLNGLTGSASETFDLGS